MDREFEELLGECSPQVRALALATRARIQSLKLGAAEKVVKGYRSVSYGFGSGMKDQFVAIVLHKGHVNLQFHQGAHLPDPDGLLEGTGKSMRHVKIRDEEILGRDAVEALIREAAARQGQ